MKKVFIQGLGFVGSAMVTAVAASKDNEGNPTYSVVGVDLENEIGKSRVSSINKGIFPLPSSDQKLVKTLLKCHKQGNVEATTSQNRFNEADIIVVDIPLDIPYLEDKPILKFDKFEEAIRLIGSQVKKNTLIIVETTVPPGTCEKIVIPALEEELQKRNMEISDIHVAHSYERVMPGKDYLASITDFWRVFAGYTKESGDECEDFLNNVINTEEFPLTRLSSMTASESSKVMENSYRATNIAFIDEWTKYAEEIGIDLFEVIDAIKKRPTHSNIMMPGLGVGGYCLTKDPAFAPAACDQLFNKEIEFPFSKLTVKTNHDMPIHTVNRIVSLLDGNLKDKEILVCGISYRQDVGDTRYSPSEILVKELLKRKANVRCHDPYLSYWEELGIELIDKLPEKNQFDAVIFAVPHIDYKKLDLTEWLDQKTIILDANMVFDKVTREKAKACGIQIEGIGRANGL